MVVERVTGGGTLAHAAMWWLAGDGGTCYGSSAVPEMAQCHLVRLIWEVSLCL